MYSKCLQLKKVNFELPFSLAIMLNCFSLYGQLMARTSLLILGGCFAQQKCQQPLSLNLQGYIVSARVESKRRSIWTG
jgi:hypothetical protein